MAQSPGHFNPEMAVPRGSKGLGAGATQEGPTAWADSINLVVSG